MAKYEILNWKTVNGIYTAGNKTCSIDTAR